MKRLFAFSFLVLLALTVSLSAFQVLGQQSEEEYYKNALAFIEANRKTDITIRAFDSITGKPVTGATIAYTQLTQAFLFSIDTSQTPADLALRSDLGATWYKAPGIEWSALEAQKGIVDFTQVDRAVRAIRDNNPRAQFWAEIRILTRQTDGNYTVPSFADLEKLGDSTILEAFRASVYNFTFRVVAKYGGTVRYWMTQAELNAPGLIPVKGSSRISNETSIQLVSLMAKAIRDANPGAVVIIGTLRPPLRGLKQPFINPDAFVNALASRGVAFDAIGINAGTSEGSPASHLEYFDKVAGLNKPAFVYATSYPSRGNLTDLPQAWSTPSEDRQADWLRLMFVYAYGNRNVMGIHWSTLRDTDVNANGLVRADGAAKGAFQRARDILRGFSTVGSGTTDSTGALVFKGFGGRYSMTFTAFGFDRWSEEGNAGEGYGNRLTVTLPRYYTFYQARILLNLAKEKIEEAKAQGFLAPISNDMLATAEDEYTLAAAAFEQNDYSLSMKHADDSLGILRLAFYTELKFKQARIESSFETPTTLITFLGLVGALIVSMLFIRGKSNADLPEWAR